MMVVGTPAEYSAKLDYDRLRGQAIRQELLSVLTDASIDLLSYEEVRNKLHLRGGIYRGLREIPLEKIVGSVGRYRDFTRTFLPRGGADRERWARLKAAAEGLTGFPPIEVFKVDDVYFVKDGNHRVSVASELEWKSIEAYVTEVDSPVSLEPGLTPMDLIVKADYADFLECTQLDRLRPEQRIEFTVPGRYQDLLTHVVAYQSCLERQLGQPVAWEEAVVGWYDTVYVPMVGLISGKNLLKGFPHRTEADLYAWLTRNVLEIKQLCDMSGVDDKIVEGLVENHIQHPIIVRVKMIWRSFRQLFRLERVSTRVETSRVGSEPCERPGDVQGGPPSKDLS